MFDIIMVGRAGVSNQMSLLDGTLVPWLNTNIYLFNNKELNKQRQPTTTFNTIFKIAKATLDSHAYKNPVTWLSRQEYNMIRNSNWQNQV